MWQWHHIYVTSNTVHSLCTDSIPSCFQNKIHQNFPQSWSQMQCHLFDGSQLHSVYTLHKNWREILYLFYRQFIAFSNNERNFKIGKQLMKLSQKVRRHIFFWDTVYMTDDDDDDGIMTAVHTSWSMLARDSMNALTVSTLCSSMYRSNVVCSELSVRHRVLYNSL